jgi:hypothetical protein
MKPVTKIYKTYNFLIRLAIILATYGFVYRQVFYKRKLEETVVSFMAYFSDRNFQLGLLLVVVLMILNWGLESLKWKYMIGKVEKVSWLKSLEAVLSGVSVSMFTPNRTGEYLGRVFILEKANRLEGILITIIGSISQLLVTLVLGLFALLAFFFQYLETKTVFNEYIYVTLIVMVPIIVFSLLLFYYNVSILAPFLKKFMKKSLAKYSGHLEVFSRYSPVELTAILGLSLIRYFVFSFQFFLLLKMFSINIPYVQGMLLIAVIYLVMSVVPTVALTELGIRGTVSIYFLGMYFARSGQIPDIVNQGIFAASSLVWVVNLVLPALLGTLFVFNLKFFRNNR